ncbi:26S proteasome non-ATPase regulatory subunit 13-like [Uloborus diversus]|uniref:26S proteasome non-ATPase regulatory subunit 13-like n=1 Tax=Uloborus diversus TaxID=327109 RepID=UPI002409AE16|nr:26S proteasome non-ATPase regulatory subunit 13-like [Uloborus diversus]XP_054713356.1 26S proteasome non-ATPase regulatory subunit 13-like [Uloborus diversus]
MRDVNIYLSAQQSKSSPERAEEWAQLEEYYNKKLWHQLTLKLLDIVKAPYFQEGTALVDLYDNFLSDFENKISPLSLVEILKFVVKQIADYDKKVEFMTKTKEKVKGNNEAVILCNIILGLLKLEKGDLEGVKKIIEETETMIDAMDGITTVHGRYYQLSSDYHQINGQHAQYYRDALRYLGCTSLDDIDLEEKKSRAFTLSLAALLGEGVYNFGELLAHPILDSLKGTSKEWVVELLYTFNSGNLAKYETLRTFWSAQADLAAHEIDLRQKISLLCLMEMTFKRPGNNRVLTFSEIANETRLPENEVELLVMKALSLGLVKGSIDQVDKTVNMSWVQPRVLSLEQIGNMKQRLDRWCQEVQSMEMLLENKAYDILT